jgi:hypothetical protein
MVFANMSPEWTKAFKKFESLTGFEPMFQDEIISGETSPREAFLGNQNWFESLECEVMNISTPDSDTVLKDCPGCNGEAEVIIGGVDADCVYCMECGLSFIKDGYEYSYEDFAAIWNDLPRRDQD